MLSSTLPELDEIDATVEALGPHVRAEILCHVSHGGRHFPIHALHLGPREPAQRPLLLLVGGVHGLERIGTQVILAHLRSLASYLEWDEDMVSLLQRVRMVCVPLLNPVGMLLGTRSNGNGVDLMRNCPVDATEPAAGWQIFRGHRLSSALPWYRGRRGALEPELAAFETLFDREVLPSRVVVALDVHSGFGARDQIWFPYAGNRSFFPQVPELLQLVKLYERTHPHHHYVIEPQAINYTAHGDLWDHLYARHLEDGQDRVFLPLTLELGSWGWIRKNPSQLLQRLGLFHPIQPHRVRRVLRRHGPLLRFFSRACGSPHAWAELDDETRAALLDEAHGRWPGMAPP